MRDTSSPASQALTTAPGRRLTRRRPVFSGAILPVSRDALARVRIPAWPGWSGWLDLTWAALWLLGLATIVVFGRWEVIPVHLIWIGFALVYGLRTRRAKPTVWVLAAMVATTFAAVGLDVARDRQPVQELAEVPLLAAMFWVMLWHGHRMLKAEAGRVRAGEENTRLLAAQRTFLQDASHQLRTPITIALGHAELLARALAGQEEMRDIQVVVGELNRLRSLSERLLVIAASEVPDFLRPEPVALDEFVVEVLARWRPTVHRRWQLGKLDAITAAADRERLSLAVDALLENAVQHTGSDDVIRLSVLGDDRAAVAHVIIEDTGDGIPRNELAHIFDRFSSGSAIGGRRGTGLGLALVRAIARGHDGEVRVRSEQGAGARFDLVLPVPAAASDHRAFPGPVQAADPYSDLKLP